jgi:predicted ATPase
MAARPGRVLPDALGPGALACRRVREGWVGAQQDGNAASIAALRRALDGYRATGTELYVSYFLWLIAPTQLLHSEIAGGLDTVTAALAMVDATGTRLGDADLHRLRGELLLARDPGNAPEAEATFRHALDIARRQGMKSWELRAATSLARLLHRQRKRDEARRTLADVYDWFTEGFDTADLTAARILLGELASRVSRDRSRPGACR